MEPNAVISLDFKYLRNIMINIGDDMYPIPMTMKEGPNTMGVVDRHTGKSTIFPHFDLEKIHSVPLQDEKIELPDRADFGSDRDFEEEQDLVYAQRREARTFNDSLRAKVYHHVTRGNIMIVNDPFGKRKVKNATGTQKPSEIAKEMDSSARDIAKRGTSQAAKA